MELVKRIADAVMTRGAQCSSGHVLVLDSRNLIEAIEQGMRLYAEDARKALVVSGVEPPKH